MADIGSFILGTADRLTPNPTQALFDGYRVRREMELGEQRNQLFQQQQAEQARQEALRVNADAAKSQYYNGDRTGAMQTAKSGFNWDVVDGLDKDQKQRVVQQASDFANIAYGAKKLPAGQARQEYFNAHMATLKAHGLTDDEIANARLGLDNDAMLDGFIDAGTSLSQRMKDAQDMQEKAYARETELMKPVTGQDGAILTRNSTGGYDTVYTPGTKPMQQIVTDPVTGEIRYVNIAGTPGESMNPGGSNVFTNIIGAESNGKQFASNGQPLTSSAGAIGAAQVMPGTAPEAARLAGLPWDENRYRTDRDYNIALGQAYFSKQVNDFGGDQEMAAAAYNAGPARVRSAINRFGGDWRNHIPDETKAYIAKVAPRGNGASAPRSANGMSVTSLGGPSGGQRMRDASRVINGNTVQGQEDTRTGEFKPYPGAGKAAPDVQETLTSIDDTIGVIDRLANHPGLSAVVGVPGVTGGLLGGYTIPGTDAAGFKSLMENFDAKAYLSQVSKMKGTGALSDAEGRKLSAAIGSLNTRQSESEFKQNLKIVRDTLSQTKGRLVNKRGNAQPAQTAQNTKTINGTTYVQRNGKWYAQ